MRHTIKSKILEADLEFSRPGSSYVYVNINGQSGTLGRQICANGELMGSTIMYSGSDEKAFAAICRNWYRAYCRRYSYRYAA